MIIDLANRILKKSINEMRIKVDPIGYARSIGVSIGHDVKIASLNIGTFGTEPWLISIGDHVEITGQVQFLTHDGSVWIFREREPNIELFGRIIIGNNVFIGFRTIFLPGVKIGDNVIIGAGSIVSKDIPSNSVAAGQPARVIKTIDEYYAGINDKKTYIRSLSLKNKKDYLLRLL